MARFWACFYGLYSPWQVEFPVALSAGSAVAELGLGGLAKSRRFACGHALRVVGGGLEPREAEALRGVGLGRARRRTRCALVDEIHEAHVARREARVLDLREALLHRLALVRRETPARDRW